MASGGTVALRAVLHKNWLLAVRNKRDTFREFGMPLVLLGVMIALSSALGSTTVPAVAVAPTKEVRSLAVAAAGKQLWVAPCAAAAGELGAFVSTVAATLASSGLNVSCLDCEAGCERSVLGAWAADWSTALGAVVFDAPYTSVAPASYRLRLDSDRARGAGTTNSTPAFAPDGSAAAPDSTPAVYIAWVLPLQAAVDAAIGSVIVAGRGGGPTPAPFFVNTKAFPTAGYTVDVGSLVLSSIVPIYMTVIFSLLVRGGLTRILVEKETKITVSLRIAGLTPALNLAAWTLTLAARQTVVVTVVVVVAVAGGIFPRSSLSLLLLFFVLMELTCIAFTFAASALFSKSRTGGAVGMLLYLALSLPSLALSLPGVPLGAKLGLALFAPCGFAQGLQAVVKSEQRRVGVTWANAGDADVGGAGVSFAALTCMLALDAVLYTALAYYLDAIVPTEFGVPRHPLFCCGVQRRGGAAGGAAGRADVEAARAFARGDAAAVGSPGGGRGGRVVARWCARRAGGYRTLAQTDNNTRWAEIVRARGGSAGNAAAARLVDHSVLALDPPAAPPLQLSTSIALRLAAAAGTGGDVEPVPEQVQARGGVHVRALCKVFHGDDGPRLALDDLTVSMYAGQCTAILGHNGAGKSTLQRIMAGLYAPTTGAVDLPGDGGGCGYCPQHDDALFDELTVTEHLELLGGVKGASGAALAAEIHELIVDLGLVEKRDAVAGTLSGGQKRRLSIALALVGHPQVLILDEPTAGVDAAARRHVWAALSKYKAAGRVIVLATHHCDEASLLGDRVLLLARGRLRVAGSPLFLKSRYGLGYHLTAVVAVPHLDGVHEAPDTAIAAAWGARIQRIVPSATLSAARRTNASLGGGTGKAAAGAAALEMSFVLRSDDGFVALFSELEALRAQADGSLAAAAGSAGAAAPPSAGGGPWPPQPLLDFGVSVTTLEEVFLRVGELLDQEEAAERDARIASWTPAEAAVAAFSPEKAASIAEVPSSSSAASDEWWLDARRRWASAAPPSPSDASEAACAVRDGVAGYAAALADAGVALPPQRRGLPPRGSLSALIRQVALQTHRRFSQARRDPRGVALQSVVPLVFVGISAAFRALTALGSLATTSTAIFDAATFAGPLSAPGAPPSFQLPYAVLGGGSGDPAFDALVETTMAVFPAPPPPAPFPGVPPTDAAAASAAVAAGAWAAGALLLEPNIWPTGSYVLTLMYNQTLTQALPTLLSLWSSATLAVVLNASGAPHRFITASLDPLPPSPGDTGTSLSSLGDYLAPSLMGMYTAMGLLMIPAAIANKVVTERTSRAKQMQLIAGASPAGYWLSMYLWDAAMWLPTWVAACVIVAAVVPPALRAAPSFAALATLLLATGLALPLPAYVASFAFSKPADAQMGVRLLGTLVLIALFAVSLPLTLPGIGDINDELTSVANALDYLGILFPPYALTRGYSVVGVASVCPPALVAAGLPCVLASPLGWSAGGRFVVFALLSIPVWAAVLAALERAPPAPHRRHPHVEDAPAAPAAAAAHYGTAAARGATLALEEDGDVRREREQLRELLAARADAVVGGADGDGSTAAVLAAVDALGLRKVFPASGGRQKVAVADLWLHVGEGDVLGLLGANGAGKSTTISMAVGETAPTGDGEVLLCGLEPGAARRAGLLGFCPQADALFDNFTAREHIAFYAALSGTPAEHVPALVAAAIAALDLGAHADTLSQHLSGGNKRRLSLVLAYAGAPRVVLIDEPTTGVDPAARRRIFAVVQRAAPRRATVATTHLIEEAAALCNRVGIMAAGRLACLGSPAHLAATYGAGYSIELSVGGSAAASDADATAGPPPAVAAAIAAAAPGARLVDANGVVLRFEVRELSLARAFDALEAARRAGAIADYAVSASSLESVFLRFSRRQEAADEAWAAEEAAVRRSRLAHRC